jgi:hypothetical protein
MEIHEIPVEMLNGRSDWAATLGCTVDVLWSNGKLTKRFAENSLEVISDEGR